MDFLIQFMDFPNYIYGFPKFYLWISYILVMNFPNSIYGFPNLHIYGLIEKYPQIASDWMEENESNLVEIESEERQQHNSWAVI